MAANRPANAAALIISINSFCIARRPASRAQPSPAALAVIHKIKGTTVNETKAKRAAAATLGNFVVVKVALRITDARQEVGTAEAARGSGLGARGARKGGGTDVALWE